MSNYEDENEVGIACNACYGGFGLSDEGTKLYNEALVKAGKPTQSYYGCDTERDCPILTRLIEEHGELMSGDCAELEVYHISTAAHDGKYYEITEYDGCESVVVDEDALLTHNAILALSKLIHSDKSPEGKLTELKDLIRKFEDGDAAPDRHDVRDVLKYIVE